MTKLRDAISAGIKRRTDEFNKTTFPHAEDEWTPEQQAIYSFLNGESGGFSKILDSDKPELKKQLTKLAGIEMTSRHDIEEHVTIPPYVVITLRESMDGYPRAYPLIQSRLSGMWTEEGTGSSTNITPRGKNIRPATEDDVRRICVQFPDSKLERLYGAIDFANETKFRKALVKAILDRTTEFWRGIPPQFPEGITDKGRRILESVELSPNMLTALSIVLDDPALTKPYNPGQMVVRFANFCAVVHTQDTNGSVYQLNRVHIQAGISPHDVFFVYPDEDGVIVGNHADPNRPNMRPATEEEITEYINSLATDKLHLYASALTRDQVNSLL